MFKFKIKSSRLLSFFKKTCLLGLVLAGIFGWSLVSFGLTLPESGPSGCTKVGESCQTLSGRDGTCLFDEFYQMFSCVETAGTTSGPTGTATACVSDAQPCKIDGKDGTCFWEGALKKFVCSATGGSTCTSDGASCITTSGGNGICSWESALKKFVCSATSGVGKTPVEGAGKLPAEEGVGKTPVKGSPWELPNPLDADSFEGLVKAIAEWLYWIMIPVSAIIFLYAGFMFMTSGGDEEKIKKAKRAIFWGLVGTGIIIINYGFIDLLKDILETK